MNNIFRFFTLLVVLGLFNVSWAQRQTLTLSGSQIEDAFVKNGDGGANNNYGSDDLLRIGSWETNNNNVTFRGLMYFSLASVPTNAVVESAILTFYSDPSYTDNKYRNNYISPASNEMYVYKLTATFDENTVTWNNKPGYSTTGGVYIPSTQEYYETREVDLTAMIQGFVTTPSSNKGIVLKQYNEIKKAMRAYGSSENTSYKPKLEVTYTVPQPTISAFAPTYLESFETTSQWMNVVGDDGQFTSLTGDTPTASTGPSAASNGTKYYYMEADNFMIAGKHALLVSPILNFGAAAHTNHAMQVEFDYHMYGTNMGSLYLEASTDQITWTTLWSASGNKGNQWLTQQVSLAAYTNQTIHLRFRGVTGSISGGASKTSDLAIDNIRISPTVLNVSPTAQVSCNQTILTRSANPPANTLYYWQTATDGTRTDLGSATTLTITDAQFANPVYLREYKTATSTWGLQSAPITYTFQAPPAPPMGNDVTRSGPGPITLTVQPGGTYKWYTEPTEGTPIAGVSGNSFAIEDQRYSQKFYVATVQNGCEGIERLEIEAIISFDGLLNTIVTNSYTVDELNPLNPPIEIGSSISYFDQAGHLLQSQSKDRASGKIFATQPLYDKYRRSVGSTLSAPIAPTSFQYQQQFISHEGVPYDWQAFDDAATHYNPLPVDNDQPGTLGHFYSSNNPDAPGTTAYPYSRQDFYEDGSGEVKSSAGPGEEFRMGAGHETYGKSLPVLNGELPLYNQLRDLIVFGNATAGITKTDRLMKSVGRDPNGKEAVSYADETGNTLASLLPGGTTGHPLTASPVQLSQEKSVFEFHVPTSESGVPVAAATNVPGASLKIIDKLTGIEKASGTSVNPTLPPGFYQIEYTGSALNATLGYTLNYTNHAYNFYDNRGRLAASIAPKGMEMILAGGYVMPANAADLPFTTFYTYDFQGRLLQMDEPDAGITKYKYRKDGLIRFSQNAQQALENKLSYTDYDALGRPIESGELEVAGLVFDNVNPNAVDNAYTALNATQKNDWIRTHYDLPYAYYDEQLEEDVADPYSQTFTIGGVSWTENENVKTIYSYDDQGRVKWIRQLYAELDKEFLVRYAYDFLGNVKTVAYQPQTYDQPETTSEALWHKYTYDANYRLATVETSTDSVNFYTHATYEYYLHGPLKRVVYADDLQGVDYTYTLQGWLKQINDPANANDPSGKPDAFAMSLDYFSEDTEDHPALFNGQIRAQQHRTGTSGAAVQQLYGYDEKYQLVSASGDQFGSDYSYDVNGNLLTLQRRDASDNVVDDFIYHYENPNTNQLTKVDNYATDMEYNAIGQLVSDEKDSKRRYIKYDVSGKVLGVYLDAQMQQVITEFAYDDRGFRILKREGAREEWFVRDASGNLMSIYHRDTTANSLAQIELPIYGSGKIGNAYRQPDHMNYNYELTDHLGNVRATVSNVQLMAVASMELDNNDWEAQFFDNLSTRHSDPVMAHESYYSARLNYQQPLGPSLIAQVKEGATVQLSAWARYLTPAPEDNLGSGVSNLLDLLQNDLASNSTGEGGFAAVPTGLLSGLAGLLSTANFNENVPKAYLQYILFDENWSYLDADQLQVPSGASSAYTQFNLPEIAVANDGYLYVYIVNESEIDVHFDNLTVSVLGLQVQSTTDYYPFGHILSEWRHEDADLYRFAYQGQFAERDTVTGWAHFQLREYDSRIGRWLVPDPYRQFWSPYLAMGNDPLNLVDPDGGSTDPCSACDAADAKYGALAEQHAVTATRLWSGNSIGDWLRTMDQMVQGSHDVNDFAINIMVMGKKGASGTYFEPNRNGINIYMDEADFDLLEMALSRGADKKNGYDISFDDKISAGRSTNDKMIVLNKKSVEAFGSDRVETIMNLSQALSEMRNNSDNNSVLSMKRAADYPFDNGANLPPGANRGGSSPLDQNPDSLIERRYWQGGVKIQSDTFRIK